MGLSSRFLVNVNLASLGLLCIFVLGNASIHQRIVAQRAEAVDAFFNPEKDPVTGSKAPIPSVDVYGRQIPARNKLGREVLLIVAGTCQSCSRRRLDREVVEKIKDKAIFLLVQSNEKDIKKEMGKWPKNVYILADPASHCAEALNSTRFFPRCFLINSSFNILALQSSGENIAQFLTTNHLT